METQTDPPFAKSQTGGTFPSARVLVLCAAAVATALVTAAARAVEAGSEVSSLLRSIRSRGLSRPITDNAGCAERGSQRFWGGQYRIATGESVTVYASNSYPVDPALGQRWADFLATLVHGPELSTVDGAARDSLADRAHLRKRRGRLLQRAGRAVSTRRVRIPGSDLSAEAVITHEYGHHVAANRSDAPWLALDWGPKRWASRDAGLREGARAACSYPAPRIRFSTPRIPVRAGPRPTECSTSARPGRAETPWQIVSDAMYPTAADLTAAEQDVTNPWTHVTVTTQTAAFTRTTRTRTFTVATQLDGSLKVTLRPSAGMRLGARRLRRRRACRAHRVGPDRLRGYDGLRRRGATGSG